MDDYVALSYAGAFALIVGAGLLVGLTRGLKRSVLRLVIAVVAALSAVGLLPIVLDFVLKVDFSSFYTFEFEGQSAATLQEIINLFVSKYASEYISLDSGTAGLLASLPKMIVALVVFGLLLGVLNFIGSIVYLFTKGLVDGKHVNGKKQKRNKLLGGLVGGVNGLLIAFLTLSPLLGAADFAQPFVANATVRAKIEETLPADTLKYIDRYVNYGGESGDFVKKFLGFQGIDVLFFERLTRVKNQDGTELSSADIREFSEILDDAAWFYENMESLKNFQNLPDAEFNALVDDVIKHANGVIDFLFQNDVTNIVLTDGLKYLENEENKNKLLGNVPEDYRAVAGILINEIINTEEGAAATDSAKKALTELIATAGKIAPDARYFMKNTDIFQKITGDALSEEERTAFGAHIDNALNALFKDGKGNITVSLLGKAVLGFVETGAADNLIGNDEKIAPLLDAVKKAVFTEGASDIVKITNLYDVLNFTADLASSSVLGKVMSLAGDGLDSIGELLGGDEFKTVLENNLSKPAVSETLAGLVTALLPDKAMALPLGGFFRELGKSDDIGSELDGMAAAFSSVGLMGDPSETGGLIAAIGGVKDILKDGSGNATLVGKVFLAIMRNMLPSIVDLETEREPIGISGDEDWNAEAALFTNLLTEIENAIPEDGSTIEFGPLVKFGKILDDLKDSVVVGGDENYNGLVDMLLEQMNLKDALGTLDLGATSYSDVKWEITFNLAYVAMTMQESISDIESIEGFDTLIDDIVSGDVDWSDPTATEEVFGAIAEALPEGTPEVLQEILEGLIDDGTVADVIDGIPDEVFAGLADILGGEVEGFDAEDAKAFIENFFDYIRGLDLSGAGGE